MTIVIAKRKDDNVLILSDTMVGEPGKLGPDVMPGRLKAITIAPQVSVAFAGNADAADVVVRHARREYLRSGLAALIDMLRQESSSGDTDYVLAAHEADLTLLRISRGVDLAVSDICAIGDINPFRDLIEKHTGNVEDDLRRGDLRLRFIDRIMTNKDLGDHIGGFPISLYATPSEHKYMGHSGHYTYIINIVWGETTEQPIEQIYTGDGHFECSVMVSDKTNVPVVAVCMLQARTGFVYSPLEQPQAFRVPLAAPDFAWHGHEQEMFSILRDAIQAHVEAVERL